MIRYKKESKALVLYLDSLFYVLDSRLKVCIALSIISMKIFFSYFSYFMYFKFRLLIFGGIPFIPEKILGFSFGSDNLIYCVENLES